MRRLGFALPFRPHPEARDTLLELFKHKWGEPRSREDDGKTALVFRDEDPRVEILEDTEHGAWKVEIRIDPRLIAARACSDRIRTPKISWREPRVGGVALGQR